MGPLVMKSAKQKGFTREICQPKFSEVVLPYPSTLTLRGIEWFLKKVKNECRPGWPEEIHSAVKIRVLGWVCPRQRLRQRHVGRQFALEVTPGTGMEGRWGGAENDRESIKWCVFVKLTTAMGDPPHRSFWGGGLLSPLFKASPANIPPPHTHAPCGLRMLEHQGSSHGSPTPSHWRSPGQEKEERSVGWSKVLCKTNPHPPWKRSLQQWPSVRDERIRGAPSGQEPAKNSGKTQYVIVSGTPSKPSGLEATFDIQPSLSSNTQLWFSSLLGSTMAEADFFPRRVAQVFPEGSALSWWGHVSCACLLTIVIRHGSTKRGFRGPLLSRHDPGFLHCVAITLPPHGRQWQWLPPVS